jgi:hypothetical protein
LAPSCSANSSGLIRSPLSKSELIHSRDGRDAW